MESPCLFCNMFVYYSRRRNQIDQESPSLQRGQLTGSERSRQEITKEWVFAFQRGCERCCFDFILHRQQLGRIP